MAARNRKPEPTPTIPTSRVTYRGSDPSLDGSVWQVPQSVLAAGGAARWIEATAAEQAALAAADAAAQQRDQQVLADRSAAIAAREQESALREELAAMQERLNALESGANVDFAQLSTTSSNLAASLASTNAVAETVRSRGKKAEATAQQLQIQLTRAETLLSELQQERKEFSERLREMSLAHFDQLARERKQLMDEVRQLMTPTSPDQPEVL